LKGVAEVETVFQLTKASLGLDNLKYDVKLARGLSYYTGCIFEVALDRQVHSEITMGSIGGGGRYDNLTGSFGMPGLSGVGISFGAERIYDVLEELNLFPKDVIDHTAIVMMAFDDESMQWAFYVGQMLRNEGIAVDVYPDAGKLKKQIKYAADKQVRYAGIIGEEEVRTKAISVKNLISGEQTAYSLETLIELLKQEK